MRHLQTHGSQGARRKLLPSRAKPHQRTVPSRQQSAQVTVRIAHVTIIKYESEPVPASYEWWASEFWNPLSTLPAFVSAMPSTTPLSPLIDVNFGV
jgi:hypothetical protein